MNVRETREYVQEVNSPRDVFFEIFGTKKDYLPKFFPNYVPIIELVNGTWGEPGCILLLHYLLDGKEIISEELVEAVDEENKSVTYNIYKGDLTIQYKTLRVTFQAISRGEKTYVKWIYEYEKQNSDVPSLESLKDFAFEVTRMIDEHYKKHKESS